MHVEGKKAETESTTNLYQGTGVSLEECWKGYEGMFLYAIAANSFTNLSDICYDNVRRRILLRNRYITDFVEYCSRVL